MPSTKIVFNQPLNINVEQIAKQLPEYRYRGPFESSLGGMVTSEYIINDSDSKHSAVFKFDGKTENGFTSLETDYSPSQLAIIISRLPADLSAQLKQGLKGTTLEPPEISSADLKRVQKQNQENDMMIKTANAVGQGHSHHAGQFKAENAKGVSQKEVAITNADSKQYIVGTWGAGPCIIVAFYNPETLTAGIAHIDELTNVSSLSKYIDIAKDDTQSKLQIHLRGGDISSRNKVIEVIDQLRKRDDVEIKSCAVMETSFSGHGAMLAINAKTGETYSNFNPRNQLDLGKDIDSRMMSISFATGRSNLNPIMIEPKRIDRTRTPNSSV